LESAKISLYLECKCKLCMCRDYVNVNYVPAETIFVTCHQNKTRQFSWLCTFVSGSFIFNNFVFTL